MSGISPEPHEFVPGFTGMSCDYMFTHPEGYAIQCNKPYAWHFIDKNKENTMPQQADDINQLDFTAQQIQAELKEQAVVAELIDGRQKLYGDAVDGMTRIAKVWSGILGFEVRPDQVPLMQLGLKAVRASVSPDYSDNSDDIEGFLDIFRRVVGDDMIHARTGQEYWAEKRRRG